MSKFTLKVALLGVNSIFGKISSLLLKQSSLVRRLALYDEFNVDSANDISIINANCKVEAFLGKEKLNDALKGADVVIIGDGNLSTPHTCLDLMAPKICDYAKAIATSSPNAIVVIAASPVNILVPLLSEVLIECGTYNSNKIIGAMAVDNARANSILAAHLKISPLNVTLPVIGGTSKDTRIPLISQAKPSVSLPNDVVKKIISDVRKVDNHIFSLKKTPEALNKAYTTVQFLKSMLTGLAGRDNIMQIAFTRTNLIPDVEYFALPVQIGRLGVKKTFGLPPLLPLEEEILESSIQSIQIDIEQARQFFKSKECLMDSFDRSRKIKKVCRDVREETILKKDEKSATIESSKCENLNKNNLYPQNKNSEPLQKSYFKTNYCIDCFDKNNNNNDAGTYEFKNFGINDNSLNKCTSHAIDNKQESHNEELSQCSRHFENKLHQKENKLKSHNKPIKNKIDMLLLESNQYVQEEEKMYAGDKIIETPKPLSKQSLIEALVKNVTNKTLEEERNQLLINEKRIQSELKKKISQGIENKLNDLLSLNKTLSESKPIPFPQEDISMMESVSNLKCNRIDLPREAREQQEVYRNLWSNKTPSLEGNVTNTDADIRNQELPNVPQKNSFSEGRGHKQLNNTQNESSTLILGEDLQEITNNRHSIKNNTDKINNSLELSNFTDKTSLNETKGEKKKPLTKPTTYFQKYLLEKIINDEHSLQKKQTNNINKSLDISNISDRSLFREVTDQNQFKNTLIGKESMQFLDKDQPKEINNARKYYGANSKKSLEYQNFSEDNFLREAVERQQLCPKSQPPEFSHNNCQNVFLQRILSSVKLQNNDTNNILQPIKPSSNNDNININELNKGTEKYLTNSKKANDKYTTNSSIGNDTQLDISKSVKIKQPTIHKEEYSSYFNTKQIAKVSDITKDNKFTVKKKFTPEMKVKMQDNVSNAYQKPPFSSLNQFSPTPNLVLSVNKKSSVSYKEIVNDTSNILIDTDKRITQNKKLKLKDSRQNTKTVPQNSLSYLKRRNEIFKQFFSRPERISVNNKSTNNEAVDCLIENLFTEVEDSCELPVPVEICSNELMDSNSELQGNNNNNKDELKPDCNNFSEVSNNCERKPTIVTFSASCDICNEINQSSENENPSMSITTNNKILENKDTDNDTIHGIKLGIKIDEGTEKFDSELSDTFVSKNKDKELTYPFTEDQEDFKTFSLPNREKSDVLCYDKESSTSSEVTTDSYSVGTTKTSKNLTSNKEQKKILEKEFVITNSKNNFDDLQCKKSESKIIFKRNLGKSVQNFALKKSLLPTVKETDIKSVKVHTDIIKSNNINENHGKSKISPIVNNTEIHNSFSKLWMARIKKKTTNDLAISYIDYIRKSQPLKVSFTHNSIYSRGDELKSNKVINSDQNNTTLTESYVGNSLDLNPILINSRIKSSYNEKLNQINKVAQYSTSSVRRKSPSRQAVDKIKHKIAKNKTINTDHCVVNKRNPHKTLLRILNNNFKNKTSHKSNSYLKFHLSSKLSKGSLEDIHKYFYNRNPSHLSYISTQNLTDEICKKTKTIFTKNDISSKSPQTQLNKSLNKKHNFFNEKVLNVKNDTQVNQNSIFNYVTDSKSSYLYRKNLLKERRFFHTNIEKCTNNYMDDVKQSASKIYEKFIETRSMENLYKMYTKNLTQFEYSRGLKMPSVQTLQGGSNSIK